MKRKMKKYTTKYKNMNHEKVDKIIRWKLKIMRKYSPDQELPKYIKISENGG